MKCPCQICSGHIEFESEYVGQTVSCPHCGMETKLYAPQNPMKSDPQPPPPIQPAQIKSVRGTILDYTVQTNAGIISGNDGHRYSFQGADWKETGKFPTKGMVVDFEPQSGNANAIYLVQDISGTKTQRQHPPVATKKGVLQFQNPENGFIEEVSNAPLWVLLCGCFYFAAKGVWTHAVAGFLAALFTCGISWLIYPFYADQIMRTHYLRKGWVLYSDCNDATPKELIGKIITVPPKKRVFWIIVIFIGLMFILMILAKLSG
jgi:hypothetical protein